MGLERADLLLDIGHSINPGIDRGQIVGGFIQGLGWVSMEELRYQEDGKLLSYSPTSTKFPTLEIFRKISGLNFTRIQLLVEAFAKQSCGSPLMLSLAHLPQSNRHLVIFHLASSSRQFLQPLKKSKMYNLVGRP